MPDIRCFKLHTFPALTLNPHESSYHAAHDYWSGPVYKAHIQTAASYYIIGALHADFLLTHSNLNQIFCLLSKRGPCHTHKCLSGNYSMKNGFQSNVNLKPHPSHSQCQTSTRLCHCQVSVFLSHPQINPGLRAGNASERYFHLFHYLAVSRCEGYVW